MYAHIALFLSCYQQHKLNLNICKHFLLLLILRKYLWRNKDEKGNRLAEYLHDKGNCISLRKKVNISQFSFNIIHLMYIEYFKDYKKLKFIPCLWAYYKF